jgi:hypothetical protein
MAMKISRLVMFGSVAVGMLAQTGAPQNAFTPDQMKWGPPPPFVPPGAQVALVEGDPSAPSGDFPS